MRLLRLTTNYADYLARFYAMQDGLGTQSYDVQYQTLMADCFQWSDALAKSLTKLGYEVKEIVANAKPMQTRWARENGLGDSGEKWLFDIVSAQVRAFRPEVLFICDYSTFTPSFLRRLKAENPSIHLTLGWCGAPYDDPAVFREYDIVLSCIPELVEHFRADGHRAEHMHHAFNPQVLERIDASAPPRVDFSFSGQIVMETQFHRRREQLLRVLVAKTDLQLWAEFRRVPIKRRFYTAALRAAYDGVQSARRAGVSQSFLERIPLIKKVARWQTRPTITWEVAPSIRSRAHKPVFGLAMYQLLHDSRITLNTHIDISPRSASNMRLYEATGVGACLLTDWKDNLAELFEPEREVVTYRSADECVEKVRYLLDHEPERLAIAAAGQRRTLRDHTFTQRAALLHEIVSAAIAKGPLPASS
jgi:spore maturation protein CgeB